MRICVRVCGGEKNLFSDRRAGFSLPPSFFFCSLCSLTLLSRHLMFVRIAFKTQNPPDSHICQIKEMEKNTNYTVNTICNCNEIFASLLPCGKAFPLIFPHLKRIGSDPIAEKGERKMLIRNELRRESSDWQFSLSLRKDFYTFPE